MKILFLVENSENLTAQNLINAARESSCTIDIIPYFQDGIDQCSISQKNGRDVLVFNNRSYQASDYDGALLWCWGTATLGRKYLRIFEDQGITVLNSTYHTKVTDSKIQLIQMLKAAKIPTPRSIFYKHGCPLDHTAIERELGPPPYVFKPDYGTRGSGIGFVSGIDEVELLSKNLCNKEPESCGFVIQEFIGKPEKPIFHFRMLVIGDYVVPAALKITAPTLMSVSNVSAGGNTEFTPANDRLKELSLLATKASGLNVAGVDIMTHNHNNREETLVLEVNDGPGTKTFDKAGFSVSTAIIDYFVRSIQQR